MHDKASLIAKIGQLLASGSMDEPTAMTLLSHLDLEGPQVVADMLSGYQTAADPELVWKLPEVLHGESLQKKVKEIQEKVFKIASMKPPEGHLAAPWHFAQGTVGPPPTPINFAPPSTAEMALVQNTLDFMHASGDLPAGSAAKYLLQLQGNPDPLPVLQDAIKEVGQGKKSSAPESFGAKWKHLPEEWKKGGFGYHPHHFYLESLTIYHLEQRVELQLVSGLDVFEYLLFDLGIADLIRGHPGFCGWRLLCFAPCYLLPFPGEPPRNAARFHLTGPPGETLELRDFLTQTSHAYAAKNAEAAARATKLIQASFQG